MEAHVISYSKNLLAVTLLAIAIVVGVFPSVSNAQCSTNMFFTGEEMGDNFGWSVSGAGDVDNDGYADLIVGDWRYDAGGLDAGRAYVYSGRTKLLMHTFMDSAPGDRLGFSVSGAGDVNTDGYADLVVGAPMYSGTGGNWSGRAYIYSGKTGTLLHTFDGEGRGDHFGASVSGAGDVNNDGYADLIIGAPDNSAGGIVAVGRAYVYSGKTGAKLHTFTGDAALDWLGFSVSGAGDVNNDGFADLIVGEPGNDAAGADAGRVYVYSGQTGEKLHTFTDGAAGYKTGWSVSGAGDIDHDGFADLFVGEPGNNEGRAYVYSGQMGWMLYAFTGDEPGDKFGHSVSGVGDVNYDGYADLIVGAYFYDADGGIVNAAGRAYIYSGLTWELLYTFTGEKEGDFFGYSVSGAGDVSGDGYADVIVGAYQNNAGGSNAGQAYVYYNLGMDEDGDGVTDYCDMCPGFDDAIDSDGDGFPDLCDICPDFDDALDADGDGTPDGCDLCPNDPNPSCCCDTPGDGNNSGITNIGDVTWLISYIFRNGPPPACNDEADFNGDNEINIQDVVDGINRIFWGGSPPVCGTTSS
jgi:FG-GAP repeat/Dockerin type I domain